jgi:hypothetical protein
MLGHKSWFFSYDKNKRKGINKIQVVNENQKVCTDREFFSVFESGGNIGPITFGSFFFFFLKDVSATAVVESVALRPEAVKSASSFLVRSRNLFKPDIAPEPVPNPRSGLFPSSSESTPKLVMNSTFPLFSGLGLRLLE